MNTLTGGGVKDDQEQVVMPDYSDIWDIKPFREDEFWFMKIGRTLEAFEANLDKHSLFVYRRCRGSCFR